MVMIESKAASSSLYQVLTPLGQLSVKGRATAFENRTLASSLLIHPQGCSGHAPKRRIFDASAGISQASHWTIVGPARKLLLHSLR